MDDFLNGLVALVPSPLRGPAQAIVNRLLTIWHTVTDFWVRVRFGWQVLRNASQALGLSQLRHLYALAVTLRWFATVYVPRQANLFAQAVRTEARALYGQAIDFARGEISTARNFLLRQLDSLRAWWGQWLDWLRDEIGQLVAWANRLNDRVFGTWGTPERFASWAIGAIIDAAIGWFEDNAVRIGRRLIAQRTQILLNSLEFTEDVISRIL